MPPPAQGKSPWAGGGTGITCYEVSLESFVSKRTLLPLLALLLALPVRADEGLWTFDNLPLDRMKAKYGFAPDAALLKRLQAATVRFSGGTGSFVSRDGLVLTNHHVGRGAIQQVSTAEKDYIRNGFVAATRAQEIPVSGMELMVLTATRNVTTEVLAAGKGLAEAEAAKARRNALSGLQKAEEERTGLTVQPLTLYRGGQYWLYGYRKFTDVRLVAAPEMKVASFGGDWDNFTYPRFDMDFSLFRIYVDGKPYRPEAWLPQATTPLANGNLVMVSGHPGTTFRQETAAQMAIARDAIWPGRIAAYLRRRAALAAFAATGPEAKRLATTARYGVENAIKRAEGMLMGLRKPGNLEKVAREEQALKARLGGDPVLASWDRIAEAAQRQKTLLPEAPLRENLGCALLGRTVTLLRLGTETRLPSEKRLPEYTEGALKATRDRYGNSAPVHLDLEQAQLAAGLREAQELLGAGHPAVQALLAGRTPEAAAQAAFQATGMADPVKRASYLAGGPALDQDSLVAFARVFEPLARAAQLRYQEQVQNVLDEHGGRIAEARFRLLGTSVYPDGTGTLRLTYGPVAGYPANGTLIQPFTTFYGLFDRAAGWGPEAEDGAWSLPKRWHERRSSLDLATPYDFAYACDTVGGNSGSPVVNVRGELVGLNFDSNIEAQAGYYIYDGTSKRSIAVDARAIRQVLTKIMDARHLVDELDGR
ncbi:dipeptidyl-peptidase [Mesoterricola sediminis]|uniref:Dipeptidyl-peptidase n=1 Tax=Mesoterricola sediminis TaxID=2927980 RepID=A0AA48GS62_9BACT|nr:dipeptidyl-peptidase [Mesoterricola sediminis]